MRRKPRKQQSSREETHTEDGADKIDIVPRTVGKARAHPFIRRAKSDSIDAELLLRTLLAWLRGEPRVCSMVPVPDEADEDARRGVRERTELVSERVGLTNRIAAVVATLGVGDYNPLLQNRRCRLAQLRTGLGEPLVRNTGGACWANNRFAAPGCQRDPNY